MANRYNTSGHSAVRVVLIEDHIIVRDGLRLLLSSQGSMEVVGETADPREALSIVRSKRPDVVLLDLQLGSASGLELLPALLKAASPGRIVILTASASPEDYRQALSHGAHGLVTKEQASSVLLQAIERVLHGETWVDSSLLPLIFAPPKTSAAPESDTAETRINGPDAARIAGLTPRELEVIALLGKGLSNPEIAGQLHLSERTVRHNLHSIFQKLEVKDRSKLLIYAHRHGLI
jgi:DNA-binding NarL/FixJ family response regulator